MLKLGHPHLISHKIIKFDQNRVYHIQLLIEHFKRNIIIVVQIC